MRFFSKKILLFIEPCLSSHLLVLKAKEKRYDTFVISAHSNQRTLPAEIINASSSFFQVDTNNDEAVLDLVKKISQKFHIDGVIPGSESCAVLAAKVAKYLKTPGLTQEAALRVCRKDLIRDELKAHNVPIPLYGRVKTKEELEKTLKIIGFPCILKAIDGAGSVGGKKVQTLEEAFHFFEAVTAPEEGSSSWDDRFLQRCVLVEEYIQGKEYSVEVFSRNNIVSLVSFTEKVLSLEFDSIKERHIIRSEIEPTLLGRIEPYLNKVILALKLNHGLFHAKVRLSTRGPLLMKIEMGPPEAHIPKLIGYATGIDYYDNILRLLSGQPFSLQRTRYLNAGITFLYHSNVNKFCTHGYFKTLRDNSCVMETKAYYRQEDGISDFSVGKKVGHVILLHKDYEILKQKMAEVEANVYRPLNGVGE